MPTRGGRASAGGPAPGPDALARFIGRLDANSVIDEPTSGDVAGAARPAQLEDRALRGFSWSFLSYAAMRMLGIATTLVLARLLIPSDFGLVAFAVLAIQLVGYFLGLGLGGATIIRSDLDHRDLATVQTMMVALGLLSTACLLLFAPFASSILGNSLAGVVLAALTIPVAFGGVTQFYAALLQRELAFKRHAGCLVTQAVVAGAVSIALAALGAGVWSIVAGQIAGATVYTALLLAVAPFRVSVRFEPTVAFDVAATGFGFALQSGFSFVEQNLDYAIIGSALGARPLGAYSLAYRLGELPYNALAEPVAQVTFPGFARMQHRSEDVSAAFLSVLRAIALVACPLGLLLAASADPFVRALFGEPWLLMIGPLSLLGLWGAVRPLQATVAWLLNSLGYAGHLGRAYALLTVATTPLLVLAATRSGLTAVAAVVLGNVVATLCIGLRLAVRNLGFSLADFWSPVRPLVLAAVPMVLVGRGLGQGITESAVASLCLSVAGSCATYVAVVVLVDRRALRGVAEQVADAWKRR